MEEHFALNRAQAVKVTRTASLSPFSRRKRALQDGKGGVGGKGKLEAMQEEQLAMSGECMEQAVALYARLGVSGLIANWAEGVCDVRPNRQHMARLFAMLSCKYQLERQLSALQTAPQCELFVHEERAAAAQGGQGRELAADHGNQVFADGAAAQGGVGLSRGSRWSESYTALHLG